MYYSNYKTQDIKTVKNSLGFAERFKSALDDIDTIPKQRGRLAFISKYCGVSHTSVNKWLHGEALPDSTNLEKLCKLLNVTSDWLLLGKRKTAHQIGITPLFSLEDLAKGKDFINSINENNWKKWTSLHLENYEYLFGVEIKDNFNAPTAPQGFIAFFDPNANIINRDFVIALIEGNDTAVFRQYIHEGSYKTLITESGLLPPIDISHKKASFLGKLVMLTKGFK